MGYTALYRTWRPLTFDDVVGQAHITETLKNEIQRQRVGHAYLFCGSRGTGKTSTARILSRAINCLSPKNGNPCNECEHCRGILEGKILDITEIDAASNNGVDSIRDLREEARFEGTRLQNRIYIIDEVHMLTISAFNALLKILEEPPRHVHFILATTEAHKVPATILSRCQRFDFRRIRTADIEGQLQKILQADGFTIEDRGIRLMAEKADGSMRDALSILDQCMAIGGNRLAYEEIAAFIGTTAADTMHRLATAIAGKDIPAMLAVMEEYGQEGKSFTRFAEDFTQFLRSLLLCKYMQNPAEALDVTPETAEEMTALAAKFSQEQLVYMLHVLMETAAQMRFLSNPRTSFELATIKMANPVYGENSEALAARVSQLEMQMQNGVADRPRTNAEKPVKPQEKAPEKTEKKKAAVASSDMAAAFLKNMEKMQTLFVQRNQLQCMTILASVADAEDRNGRLCLLFQDENELCAARTMLIEKNMEAFRAALSEVANIDAAVDVDLMQKKMMQADDPLAGLTNF